MKRVTLALAAAALVLPSGAYADPAGQEPAGALASPAGGSGEHRAERRARNISLVGALSLAPRNVSGHGDVTGYEDIALVGKSRFGCPASGVDIIDVSRPSSPRKLTDTRDYEDTSMEDLDVVRIGGRDILGIGLQDCGLRAGVGTVGLELYDISNPRQPRFLSLFNGADFGRSATLGSVHELDLARTPSGRALALLAAPNLELSTLGATGGIGDLLVVDITDPANPTLLSEWGVIDQPGLGLPAWVSSRVGADARTLLHSARVNREGTLAYLSYWDAGVITLDISDPANPVYLGRTTYAPGEEGNAHSVAEARGGNLLLQADEDYTPWAAAVTSNAFAGEREGAEAFFAPLGTGTMSGEMVFVGRGCPAGSINAGSPADPYLADPSGRIALIERGACRNDNKVAAAQVAGATGVIIFNDASLSGGEVLPSLVGNRTVPLPGGPTVNLEIPAIGVARSTGLALRDGSPPVTVTARRVFNGYGALRIYDNTDPAAPVLLSKYATPNTLDAAAAARDPRWFTVHNPEVRGSTVFASWYGDGVRVIDISQPTAPREIGFWTGAGAPADAPPVDIWSVVPSGSLLLASDFNYGLYVLKLEP